MAFDIVQQLNSRQQEMQTLFGYYVSFNYLQTTKYPMLVDFHTHGLDLFGHEDIQIVCDVGPDKTLVVMDKLMKRIRQGTFVKSGDTLLRFFNHAPAHFVRGVDHEGRNVTRIIIPDSEGNYMQDTIADNYRYQFITDLREVLP